MSASPANSPLLFLVANEAPVAGLRRRGEGEDAAPFAALFANAIGDEAATTSGQDLPTEATLATDLPGPDAPEDALIADDAAIADPVADIEPGAIIDGALSAQQAANAAAAAQPAIRAVAATPATRGERAAPATPAIPPEVALAQRPSDPGRGHRTRGAGETPRATPATPATPAIPTLRGDGESAAMRTQPATPASPALDARAGTTQAALPTETTIAPAELAPGETDSQPPRGLQRAVLAGAQPQAGLRRATGNPSPARSDGNPSRPDRSPDTSASSLRPSHAATPAVPATPAQPGTSPAQAAVPAVPTEPASASTPEPRMATHRELPLNAPQAAESHQRPPAPPRLAANTNTRAADVGAAVLARGVAPEHLGHPRASTPDPTTATPPAPSIKAPAIGPAASGTSLAASASASPTPPATAPLAASDSDGLPEHPQARPSAANPSAPPVAARNAAARDPESTAAAPANTPAAANPAASSALTAAPAAALGAAPVAVASARHAEHVERSRNPAPGRRDASAALRSAGSNAPSRTAALPGGHTGERAAQPDIISAEADLGAEHSVPETTIAPAAHWTGASLARFQGLPPTAQLPAFGLSTPRPDSPDFPEVIGERLQWLVDRRIGHAEIRVVPPDLGVIEVKLQVEGDQVKVEFHSSSSEVRQALEAGLPRLRELLDAQGLTLTQSDIGKQARERGQDAQAGGERLGGELPGASDGKPGHEPARAKKGLLDEYA